MNSNFTLFNTDLFIKEEAAILRNLGKLAGKIAYNNFEWRYVTLIMFNVMQGLSLKSFLTHYNQSVIIKMGKFIPHKRAYVAQFVLYGRGTLELSDTLRWLIKAQYNSTAKFIIICTSTDNSDCDENQLFKILAQSYIVNVIFLRGSDENDEPVSFSYHITLPGKCRNSEPERINLTSDCINNTCLMTVFPEKLKNFHQCSLIISTFEQPPFMYINNITNEVSGGDGELLKLMTRILNASMVITTPENGAYWGHYQNNNWTGSLGDVYNNRAHASVCSTPLTSHKYGNFQISFTYYSMDMVWAARLPALKPSWEKLLYPLKIQVRITLLFIFIAIIFMNTFTKTNTWKKVRRALKIKPPKDNMLLYSWLLFLGMPRTRMPVKTTLLMMVYIWVWFCFVIRSAYQAALINSIKVQYYQDNLESFRDVLYDGFPYGGISSLREYYYEDRNVYDNWMSVDIDEAYGILDRILDGTSDFVIASNKEIILNHLMKYNGSKHLQIIPDKIVNSPTVIYLKKFSHLAAPISHVLSVTLEGGFIQRLYNKYLWSRNDFVRRYKDHGPMALKMEHFTSCFVLLFTGWFLSIIYFIVEIKFR